MHFRYERVQKIAEELKGYIYPDEMLIDQLQCKDGNYPDPGAADQDKTPWREFQSGTRWGGRDRHCWFRAVIVIPERFEGKTVALRVATSREQGLWDATNPQFMLYVNDELIQGLDVNHQEVILSHQAMPDACYQIDLRAYGGMLERQADLWVGLVTVDETIREFYYNLRVPLEVAKELPENDDRKQIILDILNETVNRLDLRQPFSGAFYDSLAVADGVLNKRFNDIGTSYPEAVATCIGHTHIDVAWLWTLSQTREKAARSFATVLNLMEQYPEYVFMSSQPQLYQFIKEDHPALYEKIKARIREGRWEAEGAMWVEADCNLASGESLVRQILFGTRFFAREFGVQNRVLWLPDVFGYSAALPQILKKSGLQYFMTTKISWNEYNKMPYDTFMWEGIDGTAVLTHFITTRDPEFTLNPHVTTYNGKIVPAAIIGAWRRYQQKNLNRDVLVSFGYGDGGGGATPEMLEYARRMGRGIPGCPKTQPGKAGAYFQRLEATVADRQDLPRWVGELYLEFHRGTYTSMARNKRYNRKSELLYQDLELYAVIAAAAAHAERYPQTEINKGWETILLNQFHDILPGSSIREVYEDSQKQYRAIIGKGQAMADQAMQGIASKIGLKETAVVVFNPLGFERSDVAELAIPAGYEEMTICDEHGKALLSQRLGENKVIFFAENIPAKGYKAFQLVKTAGGKNSVSAVAGRVAASKEGLSNDFFVVRFGQNGDIVSVYDKVNRREVLKPGERANVLQAFEDKPHHYDAWDINIYYQEKMWELNEVANIEVMEDGPLRATVRIRKVFLDSTVTQDICIYATIPRIDFVTHIDWRERQILLKAAFPVDIHAAKATYEIQYGNVERPTHWNTSWDWARFEVCAHKWADLSEDGYGVSLLNDCKYGYDIKDGVMRLTLLKSAVEPNQDADRENHEFTYSLYPHAGDWKNAGTVQMGYALNCPLAVRPEERHEGVLPAAFSFVRVDAENVVIEVVKKAEDSEDIIIRLYECYNRRTQTALRFGKEVERAWECDLMENDLEEIRAARDGFEFAMKPYEIKTFKVRLK